jgi:hypothetical protein
VIIGGLALGALATGAVYGVLAWQDHTEFLADPTADTASRGQFNAFMADICFAGAASLGIITAILLSRPEVEPPNAQAPPTPRPRVSFAPFASPHGAGAGASVRW